MKNLINSLFENNKEEINILHEDLSTQLLIQKEIAKTLLNNDKIQLEPLNQIICITAMAPFANNQEECSDIAYIFYWGIKQKDLIPSIVEYKNEELAYRCLLSLSLFKNKLIKRNNKGAPSPEFYRSIGIQTFKKLEKEDIAIHFILWENFIHELFV